MRTLSEHSSPSPVHITTFFPILLAKNVMSGHPMMNPIKKEMSKYCIAWSDLQTAPNVTHQFIRVLELVA